MLNQVIYQGNLTRDIELKYTPKGTAIAEFNAANNKKWTDDHGVEREDVVFLGCTAFGRAAENIAKYFKKGDPIIVLGELAQDSWEDKDTQKKRTKTYVKVNRFEFPGGARKDGATRAAPAQRQGPAAADLPPEAMQPELPEDKLPGDGEELPF